MDWQTGIINRKFILLHTKSDKDSIRLDTSDISHYRDNRITLKNGTHINVLEKFNKIEQLMFGEEKE